MSEISLIQTLQTAVGLLDGHDALRQQVLQGCDRISHPNTRIAVFGPFNFGKSTLLNALLGDRLLPMDLIPTTGAAITVKAGDELRTQVTLTDGRQMSESGTALLKEYATLSDQPQRRDAASIEVQSTAPFLTQGVELIDLPGTNDQEAQDAIVQEHLLQTDLVIQVVDGRQLMTLLEREQLRDWLLDRGISTVLFVVNFLNLVEPDDQKQVMTRLRFIAESFRNHLPPGISNLYRVDALPALRAKLQGDGAALTNSGLPTLEAALQSFVATPDLRQRRIPRLQKLAEQVSVALQKQVSRLQAKQDEEQQRAEKRNQIQQKAQRLLQQDFKTQIQALQTWLELPNLLNQYQDSAALALQEDTFEAWVTQTLRPVWMQHQKAVVSPIHKACEFFEQPRPADLWVAFPTTPSLKQVQTTAPSGSGKEVTPVAIATGVGLLLSGPVGAAVLGGASYLLNKKESSGESPQPPTSNTAQEQAQDYLTQFSQAACAALQKYQSAAQPILQSAILVEPHVSSQDSQLQLLQSTLAQLQQSC